METRETGSEITPEQARAALDIADAEEEATKYQPVPGWYFPALAGLLLGIFASNALEPTGAARVVLAILTITLAIAVAVLVGRVSLRRPGYHKAHTPWGWGVVGGVVGGVVTIAPVLFADRVGAWLWVVCGAVLAALIAGFGTAYWRRTSRG